MSTNLLPRQPFVKVAAHHGKGFTLIELMIVVVIISILTSIALPSYTDYVRRSAVQEALATLADLRIKLEQFYQSNRNYGTDGQAIPCAHDGSANRLSFAIPNSNFTFTCALTGTSPNENQAYLLTATGSSGAASGNDFTLNSNNVKGTTKFKGAATSNKNCWMIKGSEC